MCKYSIPLIIASLRAIIPGHSWLIPHICGHSGTNQEVKLKRQGAVSLFQSDAVTDISGCFGEGYSIRWYAKAVVG